MSEIKTFARIRLNLYACRVQNPNGWVRHLGDSVDIFTSGDTAYIVAGAPGSYLDNDHGDRMYGRAFTFTTTIDGGLAATEVVCQDVANQEYFGSAVSIDFNDRGQLTVAIGASGNEGAWLDETGAVYLFNFGAVLWTQVAKIRPPVIAASQMRYGSSISLRNDVLAAVGDWNLNWPTAISGFNAPVYLYYRHQGGANQWGLFDEVRSQLYDTDEMDSGGFCASRSISDKGLALSGNSLLVSAPARGYRVNDVDTTGAAFVFTPGLGNGVRPDVAGARISEVADNSTSNRSDAAYIELYNPSNVFVSLADTLIAVDNLPVAPGAKGGVTTDYYRFSPFATLPSNGCLVVSAGALMDEFEQTWGVDLDTAPYHYEIGAPNLHVAENCTYRLEQINRPPLGFHYPDTTNILDTTVSCPGGCRAAHYSTATDDWRYDISGMASPGIREVDQFVYNTRALPFSEDWSSYSFTSNNWTIISSATHHYPAHVEPPDGQLAPDVLVGRQQWSPIPRLLWHEPAGRDQPTAWNI